MTPTALLLPSLWAYAGLVGFFSGAWEAWRTDENIREDIRTKLPHGKLLVGRWTAVALVTIYAGGMCWATLWATVMEMCVVTVVHRFTYNVRRKEGSHGWWWIGPNIRLLDDSWYDTLWMYLGWRFHGPYWLPFVLATATELSVAVYIAVHLN